MINERKDLEEFLIENGCSLVMVLSDSSKSTISYSFEGYKGERFLFAMKEFEISRDIDLSPL